MSDIKPLPTPVPAMGLSYQFQVVDGISLVFQTHIDQTSGRKDIDELLDRVAGAAERQKAKIELPEIRRRRAIAAEDLRRQEREYVDTSARFDAQAAGSPRRNGGLNAHQQGTLDNAKASLKRLAEEIERWDGEIAKREAIVTAVTEGNAE